MSVKYVAKQYAKMVLQNIYLPGIYRKAAKLPVEKGKVIFACSHSKGMDINMRPVAERLSRYGYDVKDMCVCFAEMSASEKKAYISDFMREYATAEYVFLSNYFLPAASCRKRKETKLIQLWHSGGLLKKMGYDCPDDIPSYYKGNPMANVDILSVSSEEVVSYFEHALHLEKGVVRPLGMARTDLYYDNDNNDELKRKFYEKHPKAVGKKVCIYTPSFSGNASDPVCKGLESGITKVFDRLKDEYYFVVSLHPCLQKKYPELNCGLSTEELLPAADIMITDYSSVVYDMMLYEKPFIFFVPDLEHYKKRRGLCIEPKELGAPVTKSLRELHELLRVFAGDERTSAVNDHIGGIDNSGFKIYGCDDSIGMNNGAESTDDRELIHNLKKSINRNQLISVNKIKENVRKYMNKCDGHAVDRILAAAGIKPKIRMLAIDLDDTFLDGSGRMTEHARKSLIKADEAGIEVVIASGRSYSSLPEEITSLPCIRYAICSNGANVVDNRTGERVHSSFMTEKSVREVLAIADKYNMFTDAFMDGTPHSSKAYLKTLDERNDITAHRKEYLKKTRVPEDDIKAFITDNIDHLDCVNILMHDLNLRDTLLDELGRIDDIYVTSSIDYLIEISYYDCGKEKGMKVLGEKLGIPTEQMAAFGNADNDTGMLLLAGVGYAVSNASESCIEAADIVLGPNTHDSVADEIFNIVSSL